MGSFQNDEGGVGHTDEEEDGVGELEQVMTEATEYREEQLLLLEGQYKQLKAEWEMQKKVLEFVCKLLCAHQD